MKSTEVRWFVVKKRGFKAQVKTVFNHKGREHS